MILHTLYRPWQGNAWEVCCVTRFWDGWRWCTAVAAGSGWQQSAGGVSSKPASHVSSVKQLRWHRASEIRSAVCSHVSGSFSHRRGGNSQVAADVRTQRCHTQRILRYGHVIHGAGLWFEREREREMTQGPAPQVNDRGQRAKSWQQPAAQDPVRSNAAFQISVSPSGTTEWGRASVSCDLLL